MGFDHALALQQSSDDGYMRSEEELRWFFADSAAAIGFHGQSSEPSSGGVFDDAASHRAHMARRDWRFRKSAARLRSVSPLVDAMHPDQREIARLAYTPHAWPPHLRDAFRVGKRNVCLAALATLTRSARVLRDKKKPGETVLEFLSFEAAQCASSKRIPVRLREVRDEAAHMLRRALHAYEELRLLREHDRQAAREREGYSR